MKAVVTVIGKDKTGIIAAVTNELSTMGVNIEDISQTIMQEFFVMIMLVKLKKTALNEANCKLKALGEKVGVDIRVQHEELFNAMHRI